MESGWELHWVRSGTFLLPKGKRTKVISTNWTRQRERKSSSDLVPSFPAVETLLLDFPSISLRCLVMNPWILFERHFSVEPYQSGKKKKHRILTYSRQFKFFEMKVSRIWEEWKYLRNTSGIFLLLLLFYGKNEWRETSVSGLNLKYQGQVLRQSPSKQWAVDTTWTSPREQLLIFKREHCREKCGSRFLLLS